METRFKRKLELFDAVQFIRINNGTHVPEFNASKQWIAFALANKIVTADGQDLLWGYKELNRRIKPGYWIIRSYSTGAIDFKSDIDFQEQYETHGES